jgi:predicted PhzF superfamily epimerase YddE/YHI9
MKLKLWQVDAFAERPFAGNPAAVVPLAQWLPDATMQAIAEENNLAETAFVVPQAAGRYDLRWFTPTMEVPLCGHATLASAWVVFTELDQNLAKVDFTTRSGVLTVEKGVDGWHRMALPAGPVRAFQGPAGFGEALGKSLGVGPPSELHFAPKGAGGTPAPLGVWKEDEIRAMKLTGATADVLKSVLALALLATAKGNAPYDFVARFFAPGMGVPEDPVTGSMNATLTPFWAKRLAKTSLRAFQASPRGGVLLCTDDEGERAVLSGPCALYLRGEIEV